MENPEQEDIRKPDEPTADEAVETHSDPENDAMEEDGFSTSLNDELVEKIKDNPNKFIGCGS